jgi:hypothetical protein
VPDEKVLRKVRSMWLPRDLKIIFLGTELTLDSAIKRVQEWISFTNDTARKNKTFKQRDPSSNYIKEKTNPKRFEKDLSKIKCFNCQEFGHYSTNCKSNAKINKVESRRLSGGIDTESVLLNEKEMVVCFDTSASHCMIPKDKLNELKNFEIMKKEMIFKAAGGIDLVSNEAVLIEICFKGKRVTEEFWILEKEDDILLSNKIVKLLRYPKLSPITCKIVTKENKIISWNRPIKSYQDKIAFENLCEKMEE